MSNPRSTSARRSPAPASADTVSPTPAQPADAPMAEVAAEPTETPAVAEETAAEPSESPALAPLEDGTPTAPIGGNPTVLPTAEPVKVDPLPPPSAPPPEEESRARSARPAREHIPPPPPIGTRLVCESFGEIGESITVAAEVRDYDDESGEVTLWLPAFHRRWPIPSWVIRNGKWTHFPGDYPLPGENTRFDARYRTRAKSVEAAPPAPKPVVKFEPPRDARPGHVWVEIAATAGLVNAIGYTLAGDRKLRDWAPGDRGEIEVRAVVGSPELFKTL